MLRALTIRDMVLIERAELGFEPGLNVLTGETGAGKSILLDSLGFVLGWRGRGDLVRSGAARGEVTAEFELPEGHAAQAILRAGGLPEEDLLLLRRSLGADGRRQAWVNDRRVTAEMLRALADALVELQGQQDDRGLLDPRGHRDLLDDFAGAGDQALAVRQAWAARAGAAAAFEAAKAAREEAARDADYLAHALAELDALAPEPEEEAALDARRRALRAAERIRADVARAAEALGPEGAEAPLVEALRRLEAAAGPAEGLLDPALDGLGRLLGELSEVLGVVEAVQAAIGIDPGELERVEERLFAIRGLARKHQVPPDALADLAADLRARLRAVEEADADLDRLAAELAAAEAAYAASAGVLSARRAEAALRLDAMMAGELPALKLERAVFVTEIAPGEPGPGGSDRVRFTVATNPGAAPGPIDRIASGGELSRFLLALKVCLGGESGALTLIFDEIDRGVGGATADAVGRRLQALGERAQVLVVTHAPQVAARGRHHWRVGKTVAGGAARTEVTRLTAAQRREEIARMLAGDVITDEARAAAGVLMEG
ncbi:MAG TPA: DNA repair protein RecN [Amaricoccus sp.]|uniref:DNA repair protein RecN n=1 Tax=Amaricoccus sp. TaxID=1872485 RepID=UPI002BE0EC1A|nr:DNA repair protein RecN [Amaricoccus sp.]HMQ91719.1 DNA repair protein RecN [Amaricoccus sp.]HMR52569.1 DNA repair protein RecN [Amaricoccus sp.]HMR59272.1 DNA repair protein RecN [Amaricoccus sp.]HMT99561.1 DNA repair protein RecN [Amaricoccus sp.]